MNGLLTGKHERILALFRKLDHMTDRLSSLSRSHRPVLDGEHYLTDRELSGRLKISRRTLQEYRNAIVREVWNEVKMNGTEICEDGFCPLFYLVATIHYGTFSFFSWSYSFFHPLYRPH